MVKFKWKFIKKISLDKSEFKDWYTNDLGAVVTKSDLISCTCCNEKNSHKMRCYRLDCNSTECNVDELCLEKYKILQCSRKPEVLCLYKLNEHGDGVKINIKRRGMSSELKDIINELIFEKDISMPKRILIQLSKKKYNEGENAIDKPTLEQVQNYIKYL